MQIYDIKLKIPKNVKYLISVLEDNNFEAYVVGGCVRDSLLGLEPHDWDITTNALPNEVMRIFNQLGFTVIPVGLDFGTVVVNYKNENYEITTYRSDGDYLDGRHPSGVRFELSLEKDIYRRDLTINALAYNPSVGLVDYVGGVEDLNNRKIRFVGSIQDRLNEDSLRALRAIRFMCRFNYEMSLDDLYILNNHFIMNYSKLSMERISQEIIKTFSYKNIDINGLNNLMYLLMNSLIPEIKNMYGCSQINKHHMYDVYNHTLRVMEGCVGEGDPKLMLAAMFHDIGKPVVKKVYTDGTEHFVGHPDESERITKLILTRLKFSNSYIDDVCYLVKYHDNFNQGYKIKNVRRFVSKTSKKQLDRWVVLRGADINAQVYFKDKTDRYNELNKLIYQVYSDGTAITLKELKINGNDILSFGIKDKRDIKFILDELLTNCLVKPELNNEDWLFRNAKRLVKRYNNKNKG